MFTIKTGLFELALLHDVSCIPLDILLHKEQRTVTQETVYSNERCLYT